MRNVHMKFQNPSIHHSNVNTHTHTHTETDRQTDRQGKSNMPFQLFQSWGHNQGSLSSKHSEHFCPNYNSGHPSDKSQLNSLVHSR